MSAAATKWQEKFSYFENGVILCALLPHIAVFHICKLFQHPSGKHFLTIYISSHSHMNIRVWNLKKFQSWSSEIVSWWFANCLIQHLAGLCSVHYGFDLPNKWHRLMILPPAWVCHKAYRDFCEVFYRTVVFC